MKTKLCVFLITIFTVMFMSVCAKADAGEYADIPAFKVTLNGVGIDSAYREYPLLHYKDIVYVPMTYQDSRFLGLTADWDSNSDTLKIAKGNTISDYCEYNRLNRNDDKYEISICNFNVIVNGKTIDNKKEEYPLLIFRDITYFPLTWHFAADEFSWEYSYSEEDGLKINSKKKILNDFKIIGYYSGELFDEPLDNLQTDKLTHIMYAFLIPQKDGTCLPLSEEENVRSLIDKAHKDNCKVFIAVGGWSYNNIPLQGTFEEVCKNTDTRMKLAESIMEVVDSYGFDGVEIDWEYPSAVSQADYEALITELNALLEARGKELTAALNGAWSATEGPEVSKYVSEVSLNSFDFINVMCYDINNDEHSPFWFSATSVDYWLARGVSADKIVVGMPLYARPTFMQYRQLVEYNPDLAYTDSADINGETVYYNGIPTLCKKTILAAKKAGGVMLFDVNEDTNDETSIVSMIDKTVDYIELNGYNIENLEFLAKAENVNELLGYIKN